MLCQLKEPSLVQFNQDAMLQSFNDCDERNMLDFNVEMLLNNTQTHIKRTSKTVLSKPCFPEKWAWY